MLDKQRRQNTVNAALQGVRTAAAQAQQDPQVAALTAKRGDVTN
jgi:hypothetical protein